MVGQQAYIINRDNKVLAAAITAAISASQRNPLVYPVTKQGTGNLNITGNYSGALDAKFEVMISDIAFTNPVVSSAIPRCAGTGKIKDISVVNLEAQKIVITLQSTGVTTQQATAELEGLNFRAIPNGAAGNATTIEIDNSELVPTLTAYSTLKNLKVGDTALTGQEWDFDTKPILGNIVPDTAHRIRFGDDLLNVYLQYKKYVDGAYNYYFIPPIRNDVKAGSKVYFITGGRTVTVSRESTDEEYEDMVTIADFWSAVKAGSALIEPMESSIDTSRTPDSPAVRELALMTDAYALPSYAGDNSSEYAGVVESVVVGPDTETQLISAECVDNTFIGEELWNVKGSSSGDLGQVKTGEFRGLGPVGFTIPQRFPKDWTTRLNEGWSWKPDYATRETDVDPPPICLALKLGAKSIKQTLILEYTKKPESCSCPVVTFNDGYLGFEQKGGEKGMAYTIPDLNFWLLAVKRTMAEKFSESETTESVDAYNGFLKTFDKYNTIFGDLATRLGSLPEDVPADLSAMLVDFKQLVNSIYIKQATQATAPLWVSESNCESEYIVPTEPNGFCYRKTAITATTGDSGTVEPIWGMTQHSEVEDADLLWECTRVIYFWSPGLNRGMTQEIMPTVATGYVYDCVQNGTSGGEEPTWPTTLGEIVVDGEVAPVIWRCKRALPAWIAETSYTIGDVCRPIEDSLSGHEFTLESVKGYCATLEPEWPTTLGEEITDGDFVWQCFGTTDFWATEMDFISGKFYQPAEPTGYWYLCINGGTGGETEPAWPVIPGTHVDSGAARFVCYGLLFSGVSVYRWDGISWETGVITLFEQFPQYVGGDLVYDTALYQRIIDALLLYETAHGLKKNSIDLKGDVPYEQGSGDYYWKFISGDKQYLPAFTDIPYYSIINSCGCGNDYIGTKEFGLNISVPCGGSLLPGDRITIEINGSSERTYQLGDVSFLPTIAASDLHFIGGIDGDDTYIFDVIGDVNTFSNYLLNRNTPLPYKASLATAWLAGHSYSSTNYVRAVTFNGFRYECTTGGTSGSTAPTWPVTIGTTVNDNGVVWTCRAPELSLEITDGFVPFSVGDSFEFNIEGGHWKWRKDGGSWSSAISLSETPQSISEGLLAAFSFGVSPSFVVNDIWEILCLQENKSSNMTYPLDQITKGTGTVVFTFPSAILVDVLILDNHDLTAVTFEAANVSDFSTKIHTEALTITPLICKVFSTPISAKYYRLVITGAYSIGYVYLGLMTRLSCDADEIPKSKGYKISRTEGKKPFSLYNYKNSGFSIRYTSFIHHADYVLLDEMIDYLKINNDLPFYLIPNFNYPADCLKGKIDMDKQEPGSDIDYNMPPEKRIYTITIPVLSV